MKFLALKPTEDLGNGDEEGCCKKCGAFYDLREGCEPTRFCDTCAQEILESLIDIIPEPPKAITWEIGSEILTKLQNEIYSKKL